MMRQTAIPAQRRFEAQQADISLGLKSDEAALRPDAPCLDWWRSIYYHSPPNYQEFAEYGNYAAAGMIACNASLRSLNGLTSAAEPNEIVQNSQADELQHGV